MADSNTLRKRIGALLNKEAFMPPGQDPNAMAAGGMPPAAAPAGGAMPMDPAMAGGGMPPDPAMGGMPPPGGGGMPPDPSRGGMPPADPGMGQMDPSMLPPVMVNIEDLRALVEDIVQNGGKSEAGSEEGKSSTEDRLAALEENMAQLLNHFGLMPGGQAPAVPPAEGENEEPSRADIMQEGIPSDISKTASNEELYRQQCQEENGDAIRFLRRQRG